MPGYIISDVTALTDESVYEEYVSKVVPMVKAHGGRFLAAGKPAEAFEGDWTPSPAIIEFDSVDAASAFLKSDEYAPLKKLRQAVSKSNVVVVDGI